MLAARRAARRGLESCSVPYCTEYGKKLTRCTHAMCEKCVFNSIGALDSDELLPRFAFKCAICRYRYNVGAEATKTLMAKFVPTTRRKEMECACPDDCGKTYMVTHRPCSYRCFDCADSELVLDLLSVHGHSLASESEATDSEATEVDAIDASRHWGDSEVAPNANATDDCCDRDGCGGMEPETQGTRTVFDEESGASPTEEAKENDTCKMAAPRQTEASLPEACHLGSMD